MPIKCEFLQPGDFSLLLRHAHRIVHSARQNNGATPLDPMATSEPIEVQWLNIGAGNHALRLKVQLNAFEPPA